jgi:hypothetical protein
LRRPQHACKPTCTGAWCLQLCKHMGSKVCTCQAAVQRPCDRMQGQARMRVAHTASPLAKHVDEPPALDTCRYSRMPRAAMPLACRRYSCGQADGVQAGTPVVNSCKLTACMHAVCAGPPHTVWGKLSMACPGLLCPAPTERTTGMQPPTLPQKCTCIQARARMHMPIRHVHARMPIRAAATRRRPSAVPVLPGPVRQTAPRHSMGPSHQPAFAGLP